MRTRKDLPMDKNNKTYTTVIAVSIGIVMFIGGVAFGIHYSTSEKPMKEEIKEIAEDVTPEEHPFRSIVKEVSKETKNLNQALKDSEPDLKQLNAEVAEIAKTFEKMIVEIEAEIKNLVEEISEIQEEVQINLQQNTTPPSPQPVSE